MDLKSHELLINDFLGTQVKEFKKIKDLWSGLGAIYRFNSNEGRRVAKIMDLPEDVVHPRIAQSDFAIKRKLSSYDNEILWYKNFSSQLRQANLIIPRYFASKMTSQKKILVMEDLQTLGLDQKCDKNKDLAVEKIVEWLAKFHAIFLNTENKHLWSQGNYWHLDTRPDEFEQIENQKVQAVAKNINLRLKNCRFQSLVHGDAKLDNFMFDSSISQVASFDFQYVGGGIGIVDLVYFMSSVYNSDECFEKEQSLLERYFTQLELQLRSNGYEQVTVLEIVEEWRSLYHFAWADFVRFLLGWKPDHWKVHRYSLSMLDKVISQLETEV